MRAKCSPAAPIDAIPTRNGPALAPPGSNIPRTTSEPGLSPGSISTAMSWSKKVGRGGNRNSYPQVLLLYPPLCPPINAQYLVLHVLLDYKFW